MSGEEKASKSAFSVVDVEVGASEMHHLVGHTRKEANADKGLTISLNTGTNVGITLNSGGFSTCLPFVLRFFVFSGRELESMEGLDGFCCCSKRSVDECGEGLGGSGLDKAIR